MKNQSTVFLICAVHNDLEHTKTMLRCLSRQTYSSFSFIRIIIVDDGSTDGTAQYLRRAYPQVVVLMGDGQLWWAGAMHWGVEVALKQAQPGDFIVAMNNDCTFDENFMTRLVTVSNRYHRAIIAPLVVDVRDPDRIWDGGVRVDWKTGQFLARGPERVSQLSPRQLVSEVDTCTGRGVLFPIEVFEVVGNYNKQKLPHYLADYEFGLRAKRRGFPIFVTHGVIITSSIKRTGLGDTIADRLSWRQLWQLLFARRSRVNITDHFQLIALAAPPRYKLRNFFYISLKVGYLLSHVSPFLIVRPWAVRLKRFYQARIIKTST